MTSNMSRELRRFISNISLVAQLCDKLKADIDLMREIVVELVETLNLVDNDTQLLNLTARVLRRQFAVCEEESEDTVG